MKKRTTIISALFVGMLVILIFLLVVIVSLWLNSHFVSNSQAGYDSPYSFFVHMSGFQFTFIILVATILSFVVLFYIASNIKKNFNSFYNFFNKALSDGEIIDEDKFNFKEFKELAKVVNKTTKKRNIIKNELEFKRKYLQTVLDTQKNIVMVESHGELVRVNKAFYDFFGVKDLEEFKKKYKNISNFFEESDEKGYISKEVNGINWLRYILRNPLQRYKVKILRGEDEYIFEICANVSEVEDNYIVVITLNDISEIEMQRKSYEIASTIDALTKVANRLKFNMILQQQIELSKRYNRAFSLVLFDIDYFKKINDTYGHKVGDNVLVELAFLIKNSMRKSDTFARWGGEEFAVILPETSIKTASLIAEKFRQKIQSHKFSDGIDVTCSFGVVEYKDGYDIEKLIEIADQKLYLSKEKGRNQVQF